MDKQEHQTVEELMVRTSLRQSEKREYLFISLFLSEFHEGAEKMEHVRRYLDDRKISAELVDQIAARYEAVEEKLGDIDPMLAKASIGWDLNRMGRTELNILRLAVYELCFDEEVPNAVAINEAVELAKKYGSNQAPSFINGVLAKIAKESHGKDI